MNEEPKMKTLKEILETGMTWQNDLSTILISLCKRVSDLESSLPK
jgi:hypothetical protein